MKKSGGQSENEKKSGGQIENEIKRMTVRLSFQLANLLLLTCWSCLCRLAYIFLPFHHLHVTIFNFHPQRTCEM